MNYMYDNVYEKINVARQNRTQDIVNQLLDEVNHKINYLKGKEEDKKRFYNLSLKEIISNLNKTLIDVLNEVIDYPYSEQDNKEFVKIFTKKDRLIYLGIFSIIVSFILLFIFIT